LATASPSASAARVESVGLDLEGFNFPDSWSAAPVACALLYRKELHAVLAPVLPGPPWRVARPGSVFLKGTSTYQAKIGARVDPYGVYLVRLARGLDNGLVLIENLPELGKTMLPKVKAAIEPDLLFPAVLGRDIHAWFSQDRLISILMVQDLAKQRGLDEDWMKRELGKTYDYLEQSVTIQITPFCRWEEGTSLPPGYPTPTPRGSAFPTGGDARTIRRTGGRQRGHRGSHRRGVHTSSPRPSRRANGETDPTGEGAAASRKGSP
jgi:hypothetical protein